jgi:hypothetical protein
VPLELEDIFVGDLPVEVEEVTRVQTRTETTTRRTYGKKRPAPTSSAQYALLFERSRKVMLSE